MDNAVQNALSRQAEILQELEEIKLFLKLHQRFAGTKRGETEPKASSANGLYYYPVPEYQGASLLGGDDTAIRRRGRPADFADMMERIIREEGQPLSRNELVSQLEKRDVVIPSLDKPRYVGTILWRNRDRFINIPGHGYQLAEAMSAHEIDTARGVAEMLGEDEDVRESHPAENDGPRYDR